MGSPNSKGTVEGTYDEMTKDDPKELAVIQVLDVPGDESDRFIRIVFEDISGRRESFIDKRCASSLLSFSVFRSSTFPLQ
jgi:hypothetical protein